jgi:hypothetical protein
MDEPTLEKVERFNSKVRKVRVRVEHTIGRLKQRFPVLLNCMRFNKMSNVVNTIGTHLSVLVCYNTLTSIFFSRGMHSHAQYAYQLSRAMESRLWSSS